MFTTAILCLGLLSATQDISFSSDWEADQMTGPGHWRSLRLMAPDRFQRVTDIVRQGHYAVRVEVRPGDDPINSSGERAETGFMTDDQGRNIPEDESSGTQFFAFSVRLAPDWQSPEADSSSKWAIILQLHGPDSLKTSPSIAVSVQDRFSIYLYSGDLDFQRLALWNKSYPLKDSRLMPGKWVDLVLEIKFAKDFSGGIKVWRRNEGQAEFASVLDLRNIPTLQYRSSQGSVQPHYWKHGFYRSKQKAITNVLWLDGMTRGSSFDAVVRAAFGNQ